MDLLITRADKTRGRVAIGLRSPCSVSNGFTLGRPHTFGFCNVRRNRACRAKLPIVMVTRGNKGLTAVGSLGVIGNIAARGMNISCFITIGLRGNLANIRLGMGPRGLGRLGTLIPAVAALRLCTILASGGKHVTQLLLSTVAYTPRKAPIISSRLATATTRVASPSFLGAMSVSMASGLGEVNIVNVKPNGNSVRVRSVNLFGRTKRGIARRSYVILINPSARNGVVYGFGLVKSGRCGLRPNACACIRHCRIACNCNGNIGFRAIYTSLGCRIVVGWERGH